jgi:hypothetical protein
MAAENSESPSLDERTAERGVPYGSDHIDTSTRKCVSTISIIDTATYTYTCKIEPDRYKKNRDLRPNFVNPGLLTFADQLSREESFVLEKGSFIDIFKLLGSCMRDSSMPKMTTREIETAINNLLKMCEDDFDVSCLCDVLCDFTSEKMKMNQQQIAANQGQIAAILHKLVELCSRYDSADNVTFWKETFFEDMATAINELMEVSDLFDSSTLKQIAVAIDKLIEVSNSSIDTAYFAKLRDKCMKLEDAFHPLTHPEVDV